LVEIQNNGALPRYNWAGGITAIYEFNADKQRNIYPFFKWKPGKNTKGAQSAPKKQARSCEAKSGLKTEADPAGAMACRKKKLSI